MKKCSCRKGKSYRLLISKEMERLFRFMKRYPEVKSCIFVLINTYRPTDSERITAERVFHTVRECYDAGLISFSAAVELLNVLKSFFIKRTDTRRGNFLEVVLSKRGAIRLKGKVRRLNQCRLYRGRVKISDKEIDVAFSGPEGFEIHECKANMIRQWRDPLFKRTKKGRKLGFLNEVARECGQRTFAFCTGLDGSFATEYIKELLEAYGYKNLLVAGKEELIKSGDFL
ncbi:hypothetical protein [Desulfurobacterium sp.]